MSGFAPTIEENSQKKIEAKRKTKLWRNLFLLNLCVTIMLIGFFWLPLKLAKVSNFMNSASVNIPKETTDEDAISAVPEKQITTNSPLLDPKGVLINASSDKDWAYFDFSRGKQVKIHDRSSLEWDLAFRRGKILTNGGATNKFGKAAILEIGEVDFDTVAEVPTDKYVQDVSTRTETENPALLKWYKYNYFTHKLTAKKAIYSVRTADNKYAKVQFMGFYCANDEAGCIKMKYVYQDDSTNSFYKKGKTDPMDSASTPTESISKDL
ncbi:MAG: HmuY family protein [Nitrospinales bacterium]